MDVSYIQYTEELKAIREFSSPTNIIQLRNSLGLSNYFCRFISNFSKITFQLTENKG